MIKSEFLGGKKTKSETVKKNVLIGNLFHFISCSLFHWFNQPKQLQILFKYLLSNNEKQLTTIKIFL